MYMVYIHHPCVGLLTTIGNRLYVSPISQVEFSITLQKEFDLPDMSEEEFATLKTVDDVVKFIEAAKK